ncbi:MAG: porin [Polyangiaceae bacterium]|nr:porin [Polyangiaceae bacterium]MCL4754574.1 outer membrane beta-barrel protein [Myxococcales bacterium]
MAQHRMSGRSLGGLVGLAALLLARGGAAQASVPEPPPPAEPWYEAVQLRAFADAYANANWAFPKPATYQPPTRSFDGAQGFALSWVGLDAAFSPEPVGGVLSLRLGPTARLHASADAGTGLEYVKQAYVAWKPGSGSVTLELGKFDTFVGSEVAESQDNFNYTRGLLDSFAQPLFHTGLRVTAELVPELTLTTMVANGTNRSFDNNVGKTFGLGLSVNPSDSFAASLAWIGGPEQTDSTEVACTSGTAYDPDAGTCAAKAGAPAQTHVVDRGGANDFDSWRHLIDLTLTVQPLETLAIALNADYGVEGVRPDDTSIEAKPEAQKWYGAALFARMQLNETWAVAVRGEYLADPDGRALSYTLPGGALLDKTELASATLTVEARPTENLILRLENRGDFVLKGEPDEEIFREKVRDGSSKLFTTTLGVVVTTN